MEILRSQRDGYLEMFFEGRLDGYWAQHLAQSVGETMRHGTHAVRLNLSKTNYISSAGIGTLVQLYKEFAAVNGSFAVAEPSPQVRQIIVMVGLEEMLLGTAPVTAAVSGDGFEIHECAAGATLTCRVSGDATRLGAAGFTEADCRQVSLGESGIALGLGALGEGFENCRERFGEFLAVTGAAAYQPTDGSNYPDYMMSSGTFVPQVTALYGLRCEGAFATLVRFEDAMTLSSLASKCLEVSGSATAAFAIIAESGGLMGAALKKAPVNGGSVFAFPEVQSWLSFSPERCYSHNLVLLAGVASTSPPELLRPMLRPLAKGAAWGHFHAAAFGYRPLQKGRLDLRTAVKGLFEAGGPQAVLHLLGDDRERGGGETELLRGACWMGPVAEIAA